MRKGEFAHYEQFLLFPQCFQKASFPGASKGVIVWEWVKEVIQVKPQFYQVSSLCNFPIQKYVQKGEKWP